MLTFEIIKWNYFNGKIYFQKKMAQLYHLETITIITMEKSSIIYSTTDNPKSSKKYKTIPFDFCIITTLNHI